MGRDGNIGVSNAALMDAVNDPLKIVNQTGGRLKYIGKNATVVLNAAKYVITAWATNTAGIKQEVKECSYYQTMI